MPAVRPSDLRPYKGQGYRLVEAQHKSSSMKLTDTVQEQALLETLLEATKPHLPPEARNLHYLLAAPFRYAPYPHSSRFRPAGMSAGVFYCAEKVETAVAEMAFYRLLFYAHSPQAKWPKNPESLTAFHVRLSATAMAELMKPPFAQDAEKWTHPTDYSACLALAADARAAGADLIRYQSVRAAKGKAALAVLTPSVFASGPQDLRGWRFRVGPYGVMAQEDYGAQRSLEFGRDAFTADPRLREMIWQR